MLLLILLIEEDTEYMRKGREQLNEVPMLVWKKTMDRLK